MFRLSVLSIIALCFMHEQCMLDYLMWSIVIGVIKRVKVTDRRFIKQYQGDKCDSELSVKYNIQRKKKKRDEKILGRKIILYGMISAVSFFLFPTPLRLHLFVSIKCTWHFSRLANLERNLSRCFFDPYLLGTPKELISVAIAPRGSCPQCTRRNALDYLVFDGDL